MLSIIAAVGKNYEIGKNNDLVFHFKEDMKFFREMTKGKTVIMGRKCFESMPGLLPNRKSIIITRSNDYKVDGAIIMHSIDEVLNYLNNTNEDAFVIGGAKIYEEFMQHSDNMYLTFIDKAADADTFFPPFKLENYEMKVIKLVNENETKLEFREYKKL